MEYNKMDQGGRKWQVEKGGAEKKREKKRKVLFAENGKSANTVELFCKKPVPGDVPGGAPSCSAAAAAKLTEIKLTKK